MDRNDTLRIEGRNVDHDHEQYKNKIRCPRHSRKIKDKIDVQTVKKTERKINRISFIVIVRFDIISVFFTVLFIYYSQ